MAEELEKTKQYKYQSNANLVIQRGGSDIGGIGRHESGPTGESSTLSTVRSCSIRTAYLYSVPCYPRFNFSLIDLISLFVSSLFTV